MARPPSLDAAKARKAAAHPDRPGTDCTSPAGTPVIEIDRAKCEGKGDCVDVCPYNVFAVGKISDADYARLGLLGKLKSLAHGKKTALTPHLADCRACGLCVVACPEKALRLVVPA